jgi:hypothetical protein
MLLEMEYAGKPVVALDDESPVVQAVNRLSAQLVGNAVVA